MTAIFKATNETRVSLKDRYIVLSLQKIGISCAVNVEEDRNRHQDAYWVSSLTQKEGYDSEQRR
jgi:hypothetical protein